MPVDRLKKKYLLGLATSLWTLLPVAAGAASCVMFWAMDQTPLAVLCGIMGGLAGAGVFCYRFVAGSEYTMRRAQQEVEQEDNQASDLARQQKEAALDALGRELMQSDDTRPEQLLSEMREVLRLLKTDPSLTEAVDDYSAKGILAKADNLFEETVERIKRTMELGKQIDETSIPRLKNTLTKEREDLIRGIKGDADAISKVMDELRGLSSADNSEKDQEYSEQGKELLMQLEAAKNAKSEIKSRLGGSQISDDAGQA